MKAILTALATVAVVAGAWAQGDTRKGPAPAAPGGPGGPPPHHGPSGPGGGMGQRLHEADTDKDGKVSFAEAQKAFPDMTKERFDAMDANHDGFLTPADRPEGGGFRQRFEEADTNHDGKLTFEEAQKAFPNMDKERFNRMDTNGDGAITPEDRPQRRGPGGPGGPGAGHGPAPQATPASPAPAK